MKLKEKECKVVLVTGGAGFIGSYTAKKLVSQGYEVIIIDNFNDYYDSQLKEERVLNLLKGYEVKLYRDDISNLESLRRVFIDNKIDIVVHQAAQAGVRYSLINPEVYQESNIKGTYNILECCREFNVRKLVFASSSSVYGKRAKVPFKEDENTDNPISFYAATKKITETMCYTYHSLYNIKMIGLRYFTCYGEWGRPDMAFFSFTKKIIEESTIDIYGEGKMKRDFTYIDDIVDGVMRAVEVDLDYEVINLGYGSPSELMYFVQLLENIIGKEAKKRFLPIQKGDVYVTYADINKAKKLLNWLPKTQLEQGVEMFVEWYKDYYKV